ncbi:sporulation integral membrane protein YtvI [Tenuibacillus multivorans]|uniref:Sporulation integral membrane protein YtvI n=1 Tax=Tenuibacillus multivorans TaxID=237069 RepID=A0A1G9ZUR7_9BACI|nr:sporulation integral membrane protein YtvI [Tenuibacillus multivorans]GEL76850.1 permease [Tenuibacillus multivorans]SDN24691.1 sporulation integral membrane protein YtvI [Tenuibacillus multivorans]
MVINYQNLFKSIAFICIIIMFIYTVFHYLLPFAISLIVAIMINPIVQALQNKLHLNRKLAVLTVLMLAMLCFITVITYSLVELVHLLQFLRNLMPSTIENLFSRLESFTEKNIERAYQFISAFIDTIQPQSQQLLKELFMDTVHTLKEYSKNLLLNFIHNTINGITNILKGSYFLLFILISTFFISADGPKWIKSINNSLPDPFSHYYEEIKTSFLSLVKKYAFAQLIIIIMTGIMVFIGLQLIDVGHALAIASAAMLFDLVPFIGISALFLPWVIVLFLTNSYALTIQISILYLVLIISRNIIEPKLIGSSIGIHPLALIIILFVFINFFGFIGLLLGPVAAVSIKALSKAGAFESLKNYITKAS